MDGKKRLVEERKRAEGERHDFFIRLTLSMLYAMCGGIYIIGSVKG